MAGMGSAGISTWNDTSGTPASWDCTRARTRSRSSLSRSGSSGRRRNASDPTMSGDCIFCTIVRRGGPAGAVPGGGEAPASIVREDADTLAFMDIQPMNPGHVLVIPKAHAAFLEDLPRGQTGPVFEAAREISFALSHSGLRCDAVSMYLAAGEEAGQEVFHTHLHLIPRFAGDGFGLRPTPGFGRIADRAELEEQAARIRRGLASSAR